MGPKASLSSGNSMRHAGNRRHAAKSDFSHQGSHRLWRGSSKTSSKKTLRTRKTVLSGCPRGGGPGGGGQLPGWTQLVLEKKKSKQKAPIGLRWTLSIKICAERLQKKLAKKNGQKRPF